MPYRAVTGLPLHGSGLRHDRLRHHQRGRLQLHGTCRPGGGCPLPHPPLVAPAAWHTQPG